MRYCCERMRYFIKKNGKSLGFDSDNVIYYALEYDEYGIVIHDGGISYITIQYCPWCGKKLPDSKRSLWFDELEKLGIKDPTEEIPKEFKTDEWWRKLMK